ncbi:hypothetical protein GW17_00038503 [Ensete ventricosum]|nr:hypothetical protein GW17_00038503 [Ensete ventricosum]
MLSTCRGGWPRPGPLQGRPAMAWLLVSGGRLWPRPLKKGRPAAARASHKGRHPLAARPQGQPPEGGRLQHDARKGRTTAGSTPAGRQPAGRGTARKGCPCKGGRQQGHHLQGRRPWRCRLQGWPPLGRAATCGQGQSPPTQGRQWRRHRGKEG